MVLSGMDSHFRRRVEYIITMSALRDQQCINPEKSRIMYFDFLSSTEEARFSHFSLGMFEEVGHHLGPNETSDETHTRNNFCSSGSDQTMQNVLASTSFFLRFFKKPFCDSRIVKVSNFVFFHLILIEFGTEADIGLKTTQNEF